MTQLYTNLKAEIAATADPRMRKRLAKCLPLLATVTARDDWPTDESLVVLVATPKMCSVIGVQYWPHDPTVKPPGSQAAWAEAMMQLVESGSSSAPTTAACLATLLGEEELATTMAEAAQLTATGKRPVVAVLLVRHTDGIVMLRTTVAMTTIH